MEGVLAGVVTSEVPLELDPNPEDEDELEGTVSIELIVDDRFGMGMFLNGDEMSHVDLDLSGGLGTEGTDTADEVSLV